MRALQVFSFVRFGVTLLISVFLVRFGLPDSTIALYETLIFWSTIATAFWVSGGQTAVLSYFPKLDTERGKALLGQVALLFLLLSSLSALGVWLLGDWYARSFTQFARLPHLAWVAIYSGLNVPGFLLHIYYQLHDRSRALWWLAWLNWGGQLVAVVAPLYLGYGLREVLVALAILGGLRATWLLGLLRQLAVWRTDWTLLQKYGRLLVPLALTALLEGSVEIIDGLLVGRFFDDPATFAYYRYGAKELPLSLLLISPVVAVGIQRMARNGAAGLAEVRLRLRRLAFVLYPVSMALLIAAPYLFTRVYSADYRVSAGLFGVYLLLISSRLLVPQIVLIAREHNYVLVVFSVIEIALNTGLSYWLIGPLGLVGIAWGSVIAYLVGKLLIAAYAYLRLGVPLPTYLPLGVWCWGNAALGLTWYFFG